MSVDELLEDLDTLAGDFDCAEHAAALIRRWRKGDFTPEEIHNFCHKLPDTVSAGEFAQGCADYQRKLYGCAPHADSVEKCNRLMSFLRNW